MSFETYCELIRGADDLLARAPGLIQMPHNLALFQMTDASVDSAPAATSAVTNTWDSVFGDIPSRSLSRRLRTTCSIRRETWTTSTRGESPKNEEIYNQSVHGLVTSSPGNYKLAFNVTPTVSEGGRRQAIRQDMSVAVK